MSCLSFYGEKGMENSIQNNEFTILDLKKENEILKLENKTLQAKYEALLNKYNTQNKIIQETQDLISSYQKGLEEIKSLKTDLQTEIKNVIMMKKKYHDQFEELINEAKQSL